MSPDFRALRRRFPVLAERAYFAAQSLGPFPEEMLADLDEYRSTLFLRNRGLTAWLTRMEELIGLFEQLLNAPGGSVALRDSATAAQAAIASTLEPTGRRNRLVISELDFHSSRYLWQSQARRGFEVVSVAPADGVGLTLADIRPVLDERVVAVALAVVSPRTGALLPAGEVVQLARDTGALTILDAYQAVGAVPLDVQALDPDVVVGGSHKWLGGGGFGLAFMYVRPELADRLCPMYPGWIGHRSLGSWEDTFSPAPGARRFQQGTPSIEPIYTARAGLRWVLETGVEAIRERSIALTERLIQRADEGRLVMRTPREPERRGGMITLQVPDPHEMVRRLCDQGFDVDARPGAGIRIGPFCCLREEECDQLMEHILEATR